MAAIHDPIRARKTWPSELPAIENAEAWAEQQMGPNPL
jgi:hypothetical protein